MRTTILFFHLLLVQLGLSSAPAVASPVHHVVFVNFKDDASAKDVQHALAEFQQLPSRIPGITGFQWGTDNSPEGLQKGFTHAFFMTFASPEALAAYVPHPAHAAFVGVLRPLAKDLFVCDIDIDKALSPAVPGRVRHLVFFKYKKTASEKDIDGVNAAFAGLTTKIPGLMRIEWGKNTAVARGMSKGFTHAYFLTFVNKDARDDYLPHPDHKAFGGVLRPHLEDVLVLDFTVRPSDRSLLVTQGLEPYRVYQRGDDGTADLTFGGLSGGDGVIEARLLSGRRVVQAFDWRVVGKASGGSFSGVLDDVPTGGEYTVEIRRRDALGNIAEFTAVANLLVGDLWILAGQSNMEGVGNLVDVEKPHPLVHNFTMAHRWELAREPLHWLIDSSDSVHSGRALRGADEVERRKRRRAQRERRTKGSGLGLAFSKHLVEHTGVPVGVISSAHGGTSMTQWDPARKSEGGTSLYGSMIKQVGRAGGRVRGVLWYQGESDANPGAAGEFAERFKGFVAAVRRDLESPELPFYYVQIGRFVIGGREAASWKIVQEAQRKLWREIPSSAAVSVIDLPLDDLIHVGTPGLKRLGARLAKIVRRELFAEKSLKVGPRLDGVKVSEDGREIHVRFSQVNGRLAPTTSVTGFSLQDAKGKALPLIYNASVQALHPSVVVLKLQRKAPAGAKLWYGAGLDPICNLVDAEDMAALAFGPVTFE